MQVKDYYKILELSPQASISEVKKSFRRLALRYHPDTNQGNRYAEAWYREIQEAYETLTDTQLREAYHQQRWLLKSQGRSFSETVPLTPPFILKQATELLEQVKNTDHFRMDHHALQQQVLLAVNDERINVLNAYRDDAVTKNVVQLVIASLFALEFPLIGPVIKQLQKLNTGGHSITHLTDNYYAKRKRRYVWERYQGFFILVLTLLLCLVIYMASH